MRHFIVNPARPERQRELLEFPAHPARRNTPAFANRDKRHHCALRRLHPSLTVDQRDGEQLVVHGDLCPAALQGKRAQVRQCVVRASATGPHDIDVTNPQVHRERDRFLEVGDIQAGDPPEPLRGNRLPHRLVNRIKVPDHHVGQEPEGKRMPGAAVGRDKHRRPRHEFLEQLPRWSLAVRDNHRAHAQSKRQTPPEREWLAHTGSP